VTGRLALRARPVTVDKVTARRVRRRPAEAVDTRDMDAGRAILDRLNARGADVLSVTVTKNEIAVEAPPSLTPPKGLELLRAIEDDPTDDVLVRRGAGFADLRARVLGRRLRLRVKSRGGAA
jgi:hypothetical protein